MPNMSDMWEAWDPDRPQTPSSWNPPPQPSASTPPPAENAPRAEAVEEVPDWANEFDDERPQHISAEVSPSPQTPMPISAPETPFAVEPLSASLPDTSIPETYTPPAPAAAPTGASAASAAPANAAPVNAVPSDTAEFREGMTFGRYLLREHLGGGWAGQTWIAEDTFVGCYVALKIAHRNTDSDAFLYGARFSVQLDDLCGVAMHDLGMVDGRAFFARTLVTEGLTEWIEDNGPLPVDRAISIAGNLASVLDAAHGASIVHGNVKPSNVLFEVADDNNEYGYLVDFLAPPSAPGASRSVPRELISATDCVAPEVMDGAAPTPASDQYGLACVVYTMLTGSTPFGITADTVGNRELTLPGATPRSLAAIRPDMMPEVGAAAAVIERALSPHPSARYSSCAEFIETLFASLSGQAQQPDFDPVHPALPDDVGASAWAAQHFQAQDDDDFLPWEDDFGSPFGSDPFDATPNASVPNPFALGGMADPFASDPFNGVPGSHSPYGAPDFSAGYGNTPPATNPSAAPNWGVPYGDFSNNNSPFGGPAAFGQTPYGEAGFGVPSAPENRSPLDAPGGIPFGTSDYGASSFGAPTFGGAPYSAPEANPFGTPTDAYANPYADQGYGHAEVPATPQSGHVPWGEMAATPYVIGEHDFDDDELEDDEYDGEYDQDEDWDEDEDGHAVGGQRDYRITSIVLGIFVGVVLIVALFLLIKMFFGGSAKSSAPTPNASAPQSVPASTISATQGGLSSAEAAIAAQLAPEVKPTCTSSPGAISGASAAITCVPTSGASKVIYAAFPSPDAMNAQYQAIVKQSGAQPSQTAAAALPCADQRMEERPWRSSSADASKPADGRYVCGVLNKQALIAWTTSSVNILARAERTDLDMKSLSSWWLKNGGPYPPAK
ncbi:MAG: protein kinase domain-containing protein [Acidimicrobiia bacterium]